MRRYAHSLALALLTPAFPLALHAQQSSNPGGLKVTAQIAVGTLMTPAGFIGGGLVTRWAARQLGVPEETAVSAAYIGGWTTAALTTALAPTAIVRGGNYPSAVVGAVAGGAAGGAVVWLGRRLYRDADSCNAVCWTLGAVAVTLPAIGATVAYNRSR